MAAPAASLDLALNLPQWRAAQSLAPRRTIFLGWGRGVGKSWFVRSQWWLLVAKWDGKVRSNALKAFKGVRITVLMPTLTQFKDVHWSGIENELGPGGDWAFLGAKLDKQRGHISFPGGSWVKAFPASAYNSRTARGMRCDVLSCDEFDDIDSEVYDAVAIPWLSEPWSLGIELLGGTPTRGRHGLWWRTMRDGRRGEQLRSGAEPESEDEKTKASIYAYHATFMDAPETVSAEAARKARATIPEATYRREYLADPDAGEGLVYPFDESFHVKEPPNAGFQEYIVGVDWGMNDPAVLLLGAVQGHGEDACLWLIDEWYETEVPNHIWNERAKAWSYATFWPDPSRNDRIADFRHIGLRVNELETGRLNSVHPGIARVADLLFIRQLESGERYSRLYVSPRCKNTIREFGLYARKKLPDGTFDEDPADRHNHAMDALRYMCMGRFGKAPNYRSTASGR